MHSDKTHILVLPRYSRNGASSRLRTYNYASALEAQNFRINQIPFFDEIYLTKLYGGRRKNFGNIKYYFRRAFQLIKYKNVDVIWLEKELFPWMPWAIERLFLPNNIPIVTDYDDAIFHRYDLHNSKIVRYLIGKKIDRIMQASDLVLAGNNYLAERARKSGAKKIEIVPTVVDLNLYSTKKTPIEGDRPRIGWIGTPSTWQQYYVPLMPTLTELAHRNDAILRIVGAKSVPEKNKYVEFLTWSEEGEVETIRGMDIGIMPLDHSPWSMGKCGYKLIQYMACGLPVIASPVGANLQIIKHGVNGFFAKNELEWAAAIERLLNDEGLRKRMGAEGRKIVERDYSLQKYGPIVSKNIANLLNRAKKSSSE